MEQLLVGLSTFASMSGAAKVMSDYIAPTVQTLAGLAALVCTFFIVNAGYLYMTSSGQPDRLEHAKRVLRNSLLGLVIVLSAMTIASLLSHAYGAPHGVTEATLPKLQTISPEQPSNGLVDVLIKAVVGFLNTIIQAVATPFLAALDYFTKATPLMAQNASVFNLWLAIVGIADGLLIIVLALIGFHVMSAASFGFDEIEFKHLLPRIALVFLLMNTSIFAIDGIIELSNTLITAIGSVSGAGSVWETLTAVLKEAGAQSLAALLLMLAFLILSVVLLVYYVARMVTLFIGAVMSPLVILVWLVPGFRDFSETAIKTYLTTIFTLFVHVVILQLAASLLTGMSVTHGGEVPSVLMAMIAGLATILILLRTQSVMMQFSYVSMGSRNIRKLGGQFVNGVSYMAGKGRAAASAVHSKTENVKRARAMSNVESRAVRTGKPQSIRYQNKKGTAEITYSAKPSGAKTGTMYEAPKVTVSRVSGSRSKDK